MASTDTNESTQRSYERDTFRSIRKVREINLERSVLFVSIGSCGVRHHVPLNGGQ